MRALIIDSDDHVLLVRFHWAGFENPDGFWANPGGGVETGESRLETLQPRPRLSPSQLAAEGIREIRWWAPDELATSDAVFAPRSLPSLLADLTSEGPPSSPLQLRGF